MGLARVITTVVKSFTGMFQMIELYEVKKIEAAEIRKIKVSATSTDIFISPSDVEDITVELKGQVNKRLAEAFYLDVKQNKETANISVTRKNRSSFIFGFIIDRSRIDVTVPSKWYENIDVQTSSGSIEGKDLTSNVLTIGASSGSIKLKKAKVKTECSLEASSGSIQVSALQSPSNISIQTSSGSIRAQDIETQSELRMKASSGSLDARNLSAEDLSLMTSSGSILARDVQGNLNAEASSGSIRVTNDEVKGQWKLRTSSGSVAVQLDHPESLSIKFNGNSGHGKIAIDGVEYQAKSEHSFIGKIGGGENKLTVRTSSGSFRLT